MLAQVSDGVVVCSNQANCEGQAYSDFLRQYLTVALFIGLALVLVGALLGVGRILRPNNRRRVDPNPFQAQKWLTYESGVDPVGSGWSQTQVRYYIFALLFVMFDVEAVFIFPWATQLETYSTFGLIEMFVFIGLLALGLVYAWRKKVLQWL
jgi:NADH-quinone oxidoreductase subunit A